MRERLRVLVVDDSAVVRQALRERLEADTGIALVETASDGRVALRKLAAVDPDVVIMDVQMPELDGLAALKRIMETSPRPVIMLSAYTYQGARKAIRALELGAVDFLQKPGAGGAQDIRTVAEELVARIHALAPQRRRLRARPQLDISARPPRAQKTATPPSASFNGLLVAIGASTGGTEAIRCILQQLPRALPAGIVITQHMPAGFTQAFAQRLDQLCDLEVKEASQHDLIQAGRVLLAPGHSHMLVCRNGQSAYVELSRGREVNGHRPAVDVLFRSAAESFGPRTMGIILTGMGRDGAQGLLRIHQAGGLTLAQDEASCVIFGMPKAAIEDGGVQQVADLAAIPRIIQRAAGHAALSDSATRGGG